MLEFGKDLIFAADKYELVKLKMIVENVLVRNRVINKRTMSDYILLADAKNCALLKEYVISYFLLHPTDILKSDDSKELRESAELMAELTIAMDSQSNPSKRKKLVPFCEGIGRRLFEGNVSI